MPEVVLVRGTNAGDFMLGGSSKGDHNVWLRSAALRLRGISESVKFSVYADTVVPYWPHGPREQGLRLQGVRRSDGRAVTVRQRDTVDEMTREVYQSFWPDLATLWAAIEWRCAEARVLAVAAEMEALAIERGELREKLAGVRPW